MTSLVLPEEMQTNADKFRQAGELLLTASNKELPGRSSRELPVAAFLVLSGLVGLGEGTAYDVFKKWRDVQKQSEAAATRLRLPLQSAYRATGWLAKEGLIEEVGKEEGSTNSLQKTVYRVTKAGGEALVAEGLRQVQLALAWIGDPAGR